MADPIPSSSAAATVGRRVQTSDAGGNRVRTRPATVPALLRCLSLNHTGAALLK